MCTYFALSLCKYGLFLVSNKEKKIFPKKKFKVRLCIWILNWITVQFYSSQVFHLQLFFIQFSLCFFGYLSNHLDFCIIKDRIEKWKNAHNQHLNLQQLFSFNFLFRYQVQNWTTSSSLTHLEDWICGHGQMFYDDLTNLP